VKDFDDLFDELIVSMPTHQFIKQGYLVPINHFVCSNPNLSNVKQRQGDYVTKMLSDVMLDTSIMSDIIESYQDKCNGKSTIVFAVDVEHSKEIAKRYREAGFNAEHIDSNTPPQERERILNDFKSGKIKIVSNVEIITEGFDFPECEVVQLARPTKSLSLYLQMVGRVMRPANNKKEGIILDNAGLWLEHGLSIIDRQWTLYSTRKKRKKEMLPTKEVAMDKYGVIREVNRQRPAEIKGLKLVPLSFEFRRLLYFETLVLNATHRGYKLLSAYYRYKEYVEEEENIMSNEEFEYIKKRLIYLSSRVEPDKAVKQFFWNYETKRYMNPTIKTETQENNTDFF